MFIPVHVNTITATATGSHIKTVTCEKCAREFFYELSRSAKGQASSVYGLYPEATKIKAQKKAQENLAKRLARDVELVPCPNCRWVNDAATRIFRRAKYRKFLPYAVFIFVIGAIVAGALYEFSQWKPSDIFAMSIFAGGALFLPAMLLTIQHLLRKRIDPNASPGAPHVPPGTPPALVPQTGMGEEPVLLPVASAASDSDVSWAVYRTGKLNFAPLCCECLESTTNRFKQTLRVKDEALAVPFCPACQRRTRKKWWLQFLAALIVAGVIGGVIAYVPERLETSGRFVMAGFIIFGLMLPVLIVITTWSKPYRVRAVDSHRGVFKIAFRNPAYTAIVIRKLGEDDGVFARAT